MALVDLSYGLLKRDAFLWTGFRLIVGTNVVEFLEFLNDLLPFDQRQKNSLLPVLIERELWVKRNHSVSSTAEDTLKA